MAKPTTTAADILSFEKEHPAIRHVILEEQSNLQIAKEIYELRQKAGLSIQEVARRAGVPVSTVQRLEDADPRWVSLPQLFLVARAVGGRLTIERDPERLKGRQRKLSARQIQRFQKGEND